MQKMDINLTKMNNSTNELEIYRQTNEICSSLKLSTPFYTDIYSLNGNFSVLDNIPKDSLIDSLFRGICNQIIVSECAFEFMLARQSSANYLKSQSLFDQRGWFFTYGFQLIIPAIFAFLSIILNFSLVIVIVKKIPFIKICNSLILFDSICQIPIVLPFLINFIAFFLGKTVIDFHICLFVWMLSTGCSFASFMTIFLISLERLLNLAFPIRIVICYSDFYSDILCVKTSYILLLSSIANYCIIFGTLLWRHIRRNLKINIIVVGNVAAAGNEQLTNSMPNETRRILRSVLIISIVIFVGWVLGSAARKLCLWLLFNLFEKIFFSSSISYTNMVYTNMASVLSGLFTCVSIIATGINAPILIIMNQQYRQAYKDMFDISRILPQQQNN